MNKEDIIEIYKKIVEDTGNLPTYATFNKMGVSRRKIWSLFEGINKLNELVESTSEIEIPKTETTEDKKEAIIIAYSSIVGEKERLPTYSDFIEYDINRDKIKRHFGNLTRLHSFVEENHKDILENNIAHESIIFSKKVLEGLDKSLEKYKRFFITTAVNGKSVNLNFYNTIKNYCKQNNALLLILPCADVASTSKMVSWTFDKVIKDEFFINREIALNTKVYISNIKLSAKQINPTTGLSRIGQRNGSYIFASPKQALEYVATSAQKDRSPLAIMTTGAITVPDYATDKYMSERTSYIAENDHVIGGVIVEVVNSKKFHFRQVQANGYGEFVDLGVRYFPNKEETENVPVNFYGGDWHSGSTCPMVKKGLTKLFSDMEINDFIVGDFFDGKSISHHDINIPLKRVKKIMDKKHSLVQELKEGGKDFNWLISQISGSVVAVKGNHDEVLERFLMNASYVKDDNNHYDSLDLAKKYLEGHNVIKEAYKIHGNIDQFERIIWLERDEEYKIANVECGQHGDLGPGGSKASLMSLEKSYGNCIVGHTHSAAILRGVFRVGTFTVFDLDYTKGPSAWTKTGCLIYDDGSRQLINFIDSDYRMK